MPPGQPSDPPFTRRNSGAHWTAVPGDTTDPGALPDPGDAICIGSPTGLVISVDGSKVGLGGTVGNPPATSAAIGEEVDARIEAIVEAFNGHTHILTGVTTAVTTPIVATLASPAPPIAPQATTASGTVKCAP